MTADDFKNVSSERREQLKRELLLFLWLVHEHDYMDSRGRRETLFNAIRETGQVIRALCAVLRIAPPDDLRKFGA